MHVLCPALALIASLLATSANAFSAVTGPPTPVQSPACEQAVHEMYDETNKYSGNETKVTVNWIQDLHNNFWYGKHKLYMVRFQLWHYSGGQRTWGEAPLLRYCIMASDGSLIGIEPELRTE